MKDQTEEDLVQDYENAQAEEILRDTSVAIRKQKKKKVKNVKK